MAFQKLQNLEAYVKEYLSHLIYKRDVRALRRVRARIQKAIDQNCCDDGETPVLGITGPTGTISAGATPYEVNITSAATGISDSEVDHISLYINNVFVTTQEGNDFDYTTDMSAETPSEETVYYTVAVLKSGETIVSPIMQFTLVQNSPAWSFLQAQHIAQTEQTRYIHDVVVDIDPDNVVVSFIGLPSFCTPTTINVFNMRGGRHAVLVEIAVTPGVGDVGTYNFTMRANDGVVNVDKAVSLLTNASAHTRYSTRPASHYATVTAAGGAQNLGTPTQLSAVVNGTQVWTEPNDSSGGSLSFTTATSVSQPTITPNPATSLGTYVIINQVRNASTGTGGRYEDSLAYIVTIT
jgi:hypothetical protein